MNLAKALSRIKFAMQVLAVLDIVNFESALSEMHASCSLGTPDKCPCSFPISDGPFLTVLNLIEMTKGSKML